jgi:hypothetical protein
VCVRIPDYPYKVSAPKGRLNVAQEAVLGAGWQPDPGPKGTAENNARRGPGLSGPFSTPRMSIRRPNSEPPAQVYLFQEISKRPRVYGD